MWLDVEKYDIAECEGKKKLSNRFLEAFQPEFFEKVGFPTRIKSNDEVYRFIDSMHDGRLVRYCGDRHPYRPTPKEFEKIMDMMKRIYEFTIKQYNHPICVKAPLISSMNVLRGINCLCGEERPTIFEYTFGIRQGLTHKSG